MNRKLTLSIPADITQYAKQYAQYNDVSLSKLVTDFFGSLPKIKKNSGKLSWDELDPFTKSLSGSISGSGITAKNYKKIYTDKF